MKRNPRTDLLTSEEEVQLATRIQAGDMLARNTLVERNLGLVYSFVRRYGSKDQDELVQEGCFGLMRAALKFNPTKGYRFSTYATWWIWQAVQRYLLHDQLCIDLPEHLIVQINRILKCQEELADRLGRFPSVAELADTLKMTASHVEELLTWNNAVWNPISLDYHRDDQTPFSEIFQDESLPDAMEIAGQVDKEAFLQELISHLPGQQQVVLCMRYGLLHYLSNEQRARYDLEPRAPMTLKEAAAVLHLSRERIRQIEELAIERLNNLIAARHYQPDQILALL